MVTIMKTFISLNTVWVWASSLWRGFDVSRQADVSLDQHSARLPVSPGLPKPPERLHDLKGISVWEFLTMRPELYLGPFVSATLAVRELLSIFWRESGILAPYPSRVLSPVDGPLPRLFPTYLLLSLDRCCLRVLQSSPFACCNYPLHRHTSPGMLVDIFFSPLFLLYRNWLWWWATGDMWL